MLPDVRQLVAMTCLALSVLVFAFGAAALLRSAHDDFTAMQLQRAGREPGRAQFALHHGAAPALQTSDAMAAPREAALSDEPSLATLQLPDSGAPLHAAAHIAMPAQDAPSQAAASVPDSRSTLTITDRAAAPLAAAAETLAAIKEAAPDQVQDQVKDQGDKDRTLTNETPANLAPAKASVATLDSDSATASSSAQDSSNPLASGTQANAATNVDTHAGAGAQVRVTATNPVDSLRSQPVQPTRRATLRRPGKSTARVAQNRKRILAARQRTAQAARSASQQAENATPPVNLFMQGGN